MRNSHIDLETVVREANPVPRSADLGDSAERLDDILSPYWPDVA